MSATLGGTITFSPATTNWYLDFTIDVSDGYVQPPDDPSGDWNYIQNDGIYDIEATNEFGWYIHARYGTRHNSYTSLSVAPPPGYDTGFIFLGDIYVEQWAGPPGGFIDFHHIATSQLYPVAWAEAGRGMPVWTDLAPNVSRLTWNLPDSGSTALLLGLSIVVFTVLRRSRP